MPIFNDDDFSIDRFQLEMEAERNAKLMRKYGKLLTLASAKTKEEKRKLNFIESEVAEKIRRNPKDYHLTSKRVPSDKTVFGIAQDQSEYVVQFKIYTHAVRKEEDYKNAIDTVKQRGMMLKILTDLWLNNYYSKPVLGKSKLKRRLISKKDTDLKELEDELYKDTENY
jgi:hypothetical protein